VNGVLQFVPTAEGYYDFANSRYVYQYTDHLGNVRISYYKNGTAATVLEENNYYPFGLKHEGYNSTAGNPNYQYKYNGKELQETGMYDYGARFYMPDVGRWGVVDPLAEKMTRHSPYNYAFNNPVRFIDPDGRETKDWVKDGNKYIWDDRVIDERTAEQYYSGSEYIGKQASVNSVKKSTGEVLSTTTLNADGSITQNGITITEDSQNTQYFTNESGSYFYPRKTTGTFVGFSANFAAIGGFGISFGKVWDSVGDSSWYFSFNGNIGIGANTGLDAGSIRPTGGNQFLVADFGGKSASYNVGLDTPVMNASWAKGGTLHPSYNSNADYFNYNKWGENDMGYVTSQSGFFKGTGWGGGAMWTYGQTWLLNR